MGTLLAATTFLLGFAAARWRSERDFLVEQARNRHDVLLSRGRQAQPMPALRLKAYILHLWSDTIGGFIDRSRSLDKGKRLDYYPDFSQRIGLGAFALSFAVAVVAAVHASWPNAPEWSALIAILVAFVGVLSAAQRERWNFIDEVDRAYSSLPLIRLYEAERNLPPWVKIHELETLFRAHWNDLLKRPVTEQTRLISTVDLYWGTATKENIEALVDQYPDLTWALSLLGRLRLWEYLHAYATDELRPELEEAEHLLGQAASAGDPLASVALATVLEILGQGAGRRITLIDRAARSLDGTVDPSAAKGTLVWWIVPKDKSLERRVEPWCPAEVRDPAVHGPGLLPVDSVVTASSDTEP